MSNIRYYSRSWIKLRDKQIDQLMKRVRPIPKSSRLWHGNFLDGKPRHWSFR